MQQFISQQKPEYPSVFIDSKTKRRWQWRKRVGFFDLPPEIRNQIYALALTDTKTWAECGRYPVDDHFRWQSNALTVLNLTSVCKLMRREALAMTWANIVKPFKIHATRAGIKPDSLYKLQKLSSTALGNLRYFVFEVQDEKTGCRSRLRFSTAAGVSFYYAEAMTWTFIMRKEYRRHHIDAGIVPICRQKRGRDLNAVIAAIFRPDGNCNTTVERLRSFYNALRHMVPGFADLSKADMEAEMARFASLS